MSDRLFGLDGTVVAITGGLGQLGRRFALGCLERGARVAVLDADAREERVADRFGPLASEPRLLFAEADVTSRASLERALAAIERQWEAPHVLVNNAALDSPPGAPAEENGPFETYPEASWDRVVDVNLKGVFLCCQVIGGRMAEAGHGSVINVASIYGVVSPNQTIYEYRRLRGETFYKPVAYSASKSGILNLTRYLATYWAPRGVRVNTVTFAGVFNNQDAEFLANYTPHVPLGRMAREEEYVGPVVFLASEASSYMTGANLVVDGGWTAW